MVLLCLIPSNVVPIVFRQICNVAVVDTMWMIRCCHFEDRQREVQILRCPLYILMIMCNVKNPTRLFRLCLRLTFDCQLSTTESLATSLTPHRAQSKTQYQWYRKCRRSGGPGPRSVPKSPRHQHTQACWFRGVRSLLCLLSGRIGGVRRATSMSTTTNDRRRVCYISLWRFFICIYLHIGVSFILKRIQNMR